MTLKDLVSFIENDHNQEKGEIVLVVGGAAENRSRTRKTR